ncbi:MAG: DMT family transporter [Deltaproteobacteria bacterium]|jgi:drug/metabolite transporter (DMT)-like permease|nr:DMT family transporter [Deltaproteobacteria bacterium]MBW2531742.1 DMT family transporter [Deltaproteobacteria bacterium]
MDHGFPAAGEVYAVLAAFAWSVAVILFRRGGEQVPPVTLNLFKNTVGLVLFGLSMVVVGAEWAPASATLVDWLILLFSGAVGIAVADTLFFAGLNRLGAGRAAIVDCLYSPFIILCAVLLIDERVGLYHLAAAVLVGIAVWLGTWQPKGTSDGATRQQLLIGVLCGALAMLTMAVGIVVAKPVLERSDFWWATTVRLIGAAPFLLIHGLLPRHRAATFACFRPGAHLRYVLPGSVLGVYVALGLWILGFKYALASTAGVLNQTSTFFVLMLATWWLKEPLTWRKALAVVMGFAGASLAAWPW